MTNRESMPDPYFKFVDGTLQTKNSPIYSKKHFEKLVFHIILKCGFRIGMVTVAVKVGVIQRMSIYKITK